jgi:hypothetical protein
LKHLNATQRVVTSLLIACMCSAQASAVLYQDNFDDGIFNPSLWTIQEVGGPTALEAGGALRVSIPATSAGAHFYAGAFGVPNLVGDFDAQVEYALDEWPADNGIRVGLSVGGNSVERLNFDWQHPEWYLFEYNVNQWFTMVTADPFGALRMTRTGSTFTGWVFVNNGWQPLGSWTQGPTSDVPFQIWVWSHDEYFGHNAASVRFDNFYAADSAVPEPSALAMMSLGLLAIRRRRRL